MDSCPDYARLSFLDFKYRIALLLLTALLASCSSENSDTEKATIAQNVEVPASSPAFGDQIISASTGDASNLIPMIAGDASSHAIAGQLYLSLLKYDRDLNLVGQLADNWRVSKDQLNITFKLKKGLKWTDGKPLTSEDCAFTLALIQDEYTQSPYKSDYMLVKKFEAPDPQTFRVHYSEPFSPALSTWASLAILPKHVFKGEDIMDTPLSRKPKATIGPYILADWQPQQSILMRANRDYFDGKVWIDERLTRIVPDSATQFLELSAGNLDIMTLTPTQYQRLFDKKAYLKENYQRYEYLDFIYTYLGFNLIRKPFDDRKVRLAIAYAIDCQELVDGVLFGLGEPLAAPYKPGTYWVNEKLQPRVYNQQKARELLKEAGWVDTDGDGVLDKDGKPLAFTILTNNGNKQRADTATIIQYRLKEVGIKVNVRLVEWSAFLKSFINKRDFDAVVLGWSLAPDPDQYSIWHSSQTGEREFNFLTYSNPKVDQALVAARRTFDRAERKRLYDAMQKEIFNDVPMVFLYAPYSLPAIHKRIHGIDPAPAGIGHNREFWYVPKELQKYQTSQTGIQP